MSKVSFSLAQHLFWWHILRLPNLTTHLGVISFPFQTSGGQRGVDGFELQVVFPSTLNLEKKLASIHVKFFRAVKHPRAKPWSLSGPLVPSGLCGWTQPTLKWKRQQRSLATIVQVTSFPNWRRGSSRKREGIQQNTDDADETLTPVLQAAHSFRRERSNSSSL